MSFGARLPGQRVRNVHLRDVLLRIMQTDRHRAWESDDLVAMMRREERATARETLTAIAVLQHKNMVEVVTRSNLATSTTWRLVAERATG